MAKEPDADPTIPVRKAITSVTQLGDPGPAEPDPAHERLKQVLNNVPGPEALKQALEDDPRPPEVEIIKIKP